VRPGDPATSADEADVAIALNATDVRCAAESAACPGGTGADFAGRVLLHAPVRITDRDNGALPGSSGAAATASDLSVEVPVPCAATASEVGATCTLDTTLDAVLPGAVEEGARANWQLGQVEVRDPGPNGTGYGADCPGTCGDGDETVFMRQGVFIP
jgi:hypothetical protein